MSAASSHERAGNENFNNVTYQRCQFAYEFAKDHISGKSVLDTGCGNAYGTAYMAQFAQEISGIDYDAETIAANKKRYAEISNLHFIHSAIPPIPLADNSVEVVTSFQFIEHIEERAAYLKEVFRVLKPGGKLLLSTVNAKKSLARNPFHVFEYTFDDMKKEVGNIFSHFTLMGLNGNEQVNAYYVENSKWVRRILKWDIFGLHKILPAQILMAPYNLITNIMRKKLMNEVDTSLAITTKDFILQTQNLDETWDIFVLAEKI